MEDTESTTISSYSKIAYITRKNQSSTKTHNKCTCSLDGFCGVCFWDNILIEPKNVPECKKCIADTERFRNMISEMGKIENTILICKSDCTEYCLWFEWFHQKRQKIAQKIRFIYNFPHHDKKL